MNSPFNFTIRTVIIRNLPNRDFLYQVFLRLNAQSVKLSPQELRQAIAPGPFTSFADEFSAESDDIQSLLGHTTPDPRMRDVEILVRYISFQHRLPEYRGRMKDFIDDTCIVENERWGQREPVIREQASGFELATRCLREVFGERLARKPDSRSFNRALFDALSFYAARQQVRDAMVNQRAAVTEAYENLFQEDAFREAI